MINDLRRKFKWMREKILVNPKGRNAHTKNKCHYRWLMDMGKMLLCSYDKK